MLVCFVLFLSILLKKTFSRLVQLLTYSCGNVFLLQMVWMESKPVEPIPAPR